MIIKNKSILKFCKLCRLPYESFEKRKKAEYKFNVFKEHIEKKHGISIEDYMNKFEGIEIQKCKCGCGKELKMAIKKGGFGYGDYVQNHFFRDRNFIAKNSKKMSDSRQGENNPAFGKKPWNYGLTSETNNAVKQISEKMKNRIVSNETREKLKQAMIERRKNGFEGNKGNKHTKQTKELLRKLALNQFSNGILKQTKTEPHNMVCDFLTKNKIKFIEEKNNGIFSFDVYLTDYDIYIEIDGDYWHSNPIFYKDGPQTKTQKINYFRDLRKNEFCRQNNLTILRIWENDIKNNFEQVAKKIFGAINGKK